MLPLRTKEVAVRYNFKINRLFLTQRHEYHQVMQHYLKSHTAQQLLFLQRSLLLLSKRLVSWFYYLYLLREHPPYHQR